jgi:hypothetical protein
VNEEWRDLQRAAMRQGIIINKKQDEEAVVISSRHQRSVIPLETAEDVNAVLRVLRKMGFIDPED